MEKMPTTNHVLIQLNKGFQSLWLTKRNFHKSRRNGSLLRDTWAHHVIFLPLCLRTSRLKAADPGGLQDTTTDTRLALLTSIWTLKPLILISHRLEAKECYMKEEMAVNTDIRKFGYFLSNAEACRKSAWNMRNYSKTRQSGDSHATHTTSKGRLWWNLHVHSL